MLDPYTWDVDIVVIFEYEILNAKEIHIGEEEDENGKSFLDLRGFDFAKNPDKKLFHSMMT